MLDSLKSVVVAIERGSAGRLAQFAARTVAWAGNSVTFRGLEGPASGVDVKEWTASM